MAFESSPDSVLILDLAGTVEFVNRSGAEIFRMIDHVSVPGTDWLSLWTEAERPDARSAFQAAGGGKSGRFTASRGLPGGALLRFDTVVSPVCDDAGEPIAILAVSRDVTELDRARRAAQAQATEFAEENSVMRSVAEMMQLDAWEIDYSRPEGTPRAGGAIVRAMRGGTVERGIEMFTPEDQARIHHLLMRARLHGESFRLEAPITLFDGAAGWVRVYAEPVFENGVCMRIRGAGMAITEEVTARQSVERAQQRLDLAVQLAGLDVYELDLERQTLIEEGSSIAIFGRSLRFDDLWPDPVALVHPQDRPRVRREWAEALENQAPFRTEFRVLRRDAEEIWVYAVAEVGRKDGRPHAVVGAMMDISQRKRSEVQMLHTMEELREQEAHQKLLLDELNHRVKNTLATVQSVARQTLKDASPTQLAQEMFIDRLLALSATHNLLARYDWTHTSFRELLGVMLKPYGRTWSCRGPDLQLDPNFAVSVGMALNELATNAVKHGAWSCDGQVSIAIERGPAEVRITWRETGGPMVTPPTRLGFGSRLLERGVARELGGKATLEHRPEGLVFSLTAPLSKRLQAVSNGESVEGAKA
jgi:PAS domain S-box-containing protein